MKLLLPESDGSYYWMSGDIHCNHPAQNERGQCSPTEYGFYVYGTGGGCTAWRQEFRLEDGREVTMLVTQDLSHELDATKPVEVGVYLEHDQVCDGCLGFWTIDIDFKRVVDTNDWPAWGQP